MAFCYRFTATAPKKFPVLRTFLKAAGGDDVASAGEKAVSSHTVASTEVDTKAKY